MKWILLLIFTTSNGIAVEHIRMDSELACRNMKQWMLTLSTIERKVEANCFLDSDKWTVN